MDHRKGKTRKLHLYLVSIYGVPSPGIQSPSSSLVLLMGPVPNLGGLTPLKSRPYQLELVSDQPAPEPYPSLILFPGAFPRPILSQFVPGPTAGPCPQLRQTSSTQEQATPARTVSLSSFCYLGPFPRPTPSHLIPGHTVGP